MHTDYARESVKSICRLHPESLLLVHGCWPAFISIKRRIGGGKESQERVTKKNISEIFGSLMLSAPKTVKSCIFLKNIILFASQ
jgi:hypothetical protein